MSEKEKEILDNEDDDENEENEENEEYEEKDEIEEESDDENSPEVVEGLTEGIVGGIEDVEMGPIVKESFLDYAMSVIVARALPDARDGFKPVQRRIIYGMSSTGTTPDKSFKKSARIVGDVMGKYHPHGDSAIYGAMAHLAQDFATRYPLVDGHGNYGSQDGDDPAAMRYTEARLAKISMEMVKGINKNTVDFVPTYDGEGTEPSVLPARIPNLIVNGATGIAVGMATNIPPHNLVETIDCVQALLRNPELTPFEMMDYIKGPDFPGGGMILGKTGIKNYFETGQGSVLVRGKYEIIEKKNRTSIVFYEIPYMVNKKELAKKIVVLCENRIIEGVAAVNDYSSQKVGTRFQIDLKKNANIEIILNHLFKYTKLQDSFAVNMLALDNGAPRILNMKDALNIYLRFEEEIVERRTKFDLNKAEARLHILEALIIAHDNIDEVVDIIKSSDSTIEAADRLMERFKFDDIQVKSILEMPLKRLTGLETERVMEEQAGLKVDVGTYNNILNNFSVLQQVVYDELEEVKIKFGDKRHTELSDTIYSGEDEDLIEDEDVLILLTKSGYIKRVSPDEFRLQNRGGIGVKGMTTKEDDIVDILIPSRTKTDVMLFTDFGKVYRIRGYEIPQGSRTSKGVPCINLINLDKDEKVMSIISCDNYDEDHFFFFVTENGIVKKTQSSEFDRINRNGKIAITLREGDNLLSVRYTDGGATISLGASSGKVCTFHESDVRSMGRTATGVKGMNLDDAKVVGVCKDGVDGTILTLSANGYGKRSTCDEFRITSRGSKGVKGLNNIKKAGDLISIMNVTEQDNIIIVTDAGTVFKTKVDGIHLAGRATLGVKVIKLRDGESIASVTKEIGDDDIVIDDEEKKEAGITDTNDVDLEENIDDDDVIDDEDVVDDEDDVEEDKE